MQILETSSLGLRSARLTFRKASSATSVTLFPMVHVGESEFFREAYQDAFSHDVVLVEGVRSSIVRNLTRSYRWIDFERLGLVLQPKTPASVTVTERIVAADLSTAEFERLWGIVPLRYRAAFFVFAPIYGIYLRLLGSREFIARRLSLDDLPSAEEYLSWNPALEGVNNAILHARDRRLIECLNAELNKATGGRQRIAVVYGAMHIRAVVRELAGKGFACVDARWHSVITL